MCVLLFVLARGACVCVCACAGVYEAMSEVEVQGERGSVWRR